MKAEKTRVCIASSDRLSYHVQLLPSCDKALVTLNDADGLACLGPLELELTGSPLMALAELQMALTLASKELILELELQAAEHEQDKKDAGEADANLDHPLSERDKTGNH